MDPETDLTASIRKAYANRSPRAIARDERGRAHRTAKDATPERERILANARKHTYADYKAGWDASQVIALKDGKLTEDEKDELQQLRFQWSEDCPYAQPSEVEVTLMGESIPHLDAHVQDGLWDLMWWANYFGKTVDEYLGDRSDLFGPKSMAAIKASPPIPDGYVVSTRRGA